MIRWIAAACLCGAALSACAQPGVVPFGVCAHLGGGEEFADREAELKLMQAAGIRWARADWTWGYIQPNASTWRWDNYDKVVASAKAHNVTILPILCYNVDWAMPAHEHLEAWTAYVKATVKRYGADLRYWEVWNEPNISFWKPKPDAAQYAALLKATYQAIKEVDPKLQVVYGGLAGVPLGYLEESLKAGANRAFDVMAVHPYHYPSAPEDAVTAGELRQTREMLDKYGSKAPIWSTEQGWPTHISHAGPFGAALVARAAKARFPQRTAFDAAVLKVPGMPGSGAAADALHASLLTTPGFKVRFVGLSDLAGLDPASTQVLVMATGEHFPGAEYPAMLDFVRRGGLLAHVDGVPFYYAEYLEADGWKSKPFGPTIGRDPLHVGWKAWWTEKGLPEEVQVNRATAEAGTLTLPKDVPSTRWLTDKLLKGNDRFVPLVSAYDGDKLIGHAAALYLYDSELKGGFVSTTMPLDARGVTDDQQGVYQPRAVLCALADGITNYFWYEFRDGGDDPYYNEARFGMLRRNLTPKPAYEAYAALTKALGEGTYVKRLELGAGTRALVFDAGETYTVAVWRPENVEAAPVTVPVGGAAVKVTDYLGAAVEVTANAGGVTLTAGPKVQYVTGIKAEPK